MINVSHTHLDENEDDHVSEESHCEDDHREKLTEEVQVRSEVQRIHPFQAYSEYHLCDAEDHGPDIPDYSEWGK